VLLCGDVTLDLDPFAMDHRGTPKERVGRTGAGVDRYCPLAAYLGMQGFCLELALRAGTQHSLSETGYNIERALPLMAVAMKPRHGLSRLLKYFPDSVNDWGFEAL